MERANPYLLKVMESAYRALSCHIEDIVEFLDKGKR
jgi:DNA-binding Xre family transcriptional regulator